MPYPKQQNKPNCGAYAIAYYHGDRDGFVPTQGEIDAITDAIKFGEQSPVDGLEEFCDPVKMMNYLKSKLNVNEDRIKFYAGPNDGPVDRLMQRMLLGPEAKTIDEWINDNRVLRTNVPVEWQGYLISLCYAHLLFEVPDGPKNFADLQDPARIHYMLVHRTDANVHGMNSWDGEYKIANEYLDGKLYVTGDHPDDIDIYFNRLQFLYAGILIANP